MAEGTTGLLAFWIGGAGSAAATGDAGVRGMLAPWIGGAGSASAPAADSGVRSLLAFWMGGACSSGGDEPPAPAPSPSSGVPRPFRRPIDLRVRRSAAEEDDLLIAMTAHLIASGEIH